MPYTLEQHRQRHEELKADRLREEPRWRELARILRPEEQEFSANERKDRNGIDTFDSTPLYAHDDFVSGLFSEATNPADRWFEFEIGRTGDRDLMKFGPVKDWLWETAGDVMASLAPQVSGFYTEVSGWFGDMAAFGDGAMYQEEMPGRGIVDRAIAKGRIYYSRDAAGFIDCVHNELPYKGRQIKGLWTNIPDSVRDDTDYTVLHCVRKNDEHDPRYVGVRGMAYSSTFLCPEIRDWRVDGGYHELPYHFVEWERRAGRTYARGPGHNALPDMNMLDEMEYSGLKALQFEASPIWLTQSDDIMTAADLQPDAVISGAINEQGKELAKVALRGDQLHLPLAATEAKRNVIRRAFRFSLWQLANKPMTATEWSGWKEEELKAAAPHLIHVQRGLASYIGRRYRLMIRQRRIRPAPPELGQQPINIEFVSPFARALKLGRARGAMQLGTTALSLRELFPDIGDNLDGDELLRVIHEGLSNEPKLVRDPRMVEQIRQARARQQQAMAQLEQAAQAASVYADVAHAEQANTLAGGRKQRGAA
jgi:head-to-tail connecting protein